MSDLRQLHGTRNSNILRDLALHDILDDRDLRIQVTDAIQQRAADRARSGSGGAGGDRDANTAVSVWNTPALDPARGGKRCARLSHVPDTVPVLPTVSRPPTFPRRRAALQIAATIAVAAVVGIVSVVGIMRSDCLTNQLAARPVGSPTIGAEATRNTAREQLTATAASAAASAARAAAVRAGRSNPGDVVDIVLVGAAPRQLAVTAGAVWVANTGDGTLSRIDTVTNNVVATIQIAPVNNAHGAPQAVVAYEDAVWVRNDAAGTLVRIDPATNTVAQTIAPYAALDPGASQAPGAFTPTALWVNATGIWITGTLASTAPGGRLLHIDPANGLILAIINISHPQGIAATAGAIWIVSQQSAGSSSVVRVDPRSERIITDIAVEGHPEQVTVAGGAVWVSDAYSGALTRIDPATNTVMATVDSGLGSADAILGTPSGVWMTGWFVDRYAHGVVWIDATANQPSHVIDANNGPSRGSAVLDGAIWVSHVDAGLVVRIDPAH